MANVRCLSSPGRTIRDHLIRAYNHGPTARTPATSMLNGSTENTSDGSGRSRTHNRNTETLGVICSSCRGSVVGPQERQITVFLGRGCDSRYFPASNNTNKINILNGVLAPHRGIAGVNDFNDLAESGTLNRLAR